ncbi:putative F-box/FBD/LRR-repeat protein At5g44960 [Henckelia pumila]|uniref:putative F-box/FBD/LRR-repeat protein At5g44960 n=1 Tax=Henckelia pumila TaxID=405737 RepID=UPI003C6DC401
MPVHLTGTSFRGSAILPLAAGMACFALVCSGFWVLKSRRRLYPVTVYEKQDTACDIDTKKKLVDRISELSDDIICLIISKLQTRAAVRTSVLSRRWRRVYTIINKASFSCSYMHRSSCCRNLTASHCRKKFVERVDTFLQHHAVSKLMSFELVCCFHGCVMDSFRKWISFVGACGVERLSIRFCSLRVMLKSGPPVFSTDFLPEPSSLTHLHLKGGSFQTPNQNVLKVLKLEFISFTPEDVECILTNCSSLQSLNLLFCVLPIKLQIVGSALQLKSLMLSYCKLVEKIELSAINLIDFEICYRTILKLSFSNVPLLRSVVIDCSSCGVPHYVFGKIAKDLPHLERMVFITYTSFFEEWKMDGTLNELSNLTELVLLLESHNGFNLLELVTLLNACPLLQKFQVSKDVASTFIRKQAKEKVVRRDTQLKELEFNGFRGTKDEYEFILYILENVGSLKRLSISVHPVLYHVFKKRWGSVVGNPRDDEKKRRIIGQRLQGQANSKNVEIIIRSSVTRPDVGLEELLLEEHLLQNY